jgi:hypothetical protein
MSKVNLKIPSSIWTAKDTKRLASNTLATVKLRTSRGISSTGIAFKEYSTKSLYVAFKGARLKPKGGRISRTGKSIFYKDGYRQYKQESRKRSGKSGESAEVDLVLSGQLMNNLVILEATENRFRIGLTKHVQHYGYEVNKKRPYIGLTDDEINILVDAVAFDIADKLKSRKKKK